MRIVRALNYRLSSDRFDAAIGELACWGTTLLILGLGFRKLAVLPLTETELFFGVLLVLAVGFLGTNLGMLLRIERRSRRQSND